MNDQASAANPAPGGDDPEGMPELTEAEREVLEQQMKEIRVEDLLAQTVASVINLTARRLLKEDEIDLGQARIGIEAVRSLVTLLPDEVEAAIREPLSQLQMLYAQKSGGGMAEPEFGPAGSAAAGQGGTEESGPVSGQDPGRDRPDSGLWIPGR